MLGRQPLKVGCAGDSSASDVVVVVVLILGHVDGEERTLGSLVLAAFWLWDSMRARKTGRGTTVFSSESLVLRHQRWRCLQVSLPS
jgi:hypothetical protein